MRKIDRNVMGRGSTMIHDQTYYRPTYISSYLGDVALFLYREVTYRQASGTVIKRTLRDMLAYTTEQKMADAIKASDWIEGVEE